jgi:ComF family protein
MLSLFSYQTEALQPMLFQWKHHPTDTLTEIMAQYLRRGWQKGLFPADLDGICFCPRSRFARHREGFDQAELLAQLLSQITGIPFIPLLERRGFSLPQHKRKARQRERNVKNAFSPLRPLAGDHILLVDDIVTTGATAREAARVLKKAGAMRVTVFSLAH